MVNVLAPNDWVRVSVSDICVSLNYGTSQKSVPTGKCAVLRMGNMQGGRLNWDDLVYTDDEHDIEKYKLDKYDVLFNRTNSAEKVGKTSIYLAEQPAIYAGYLVKLNYKKDVILGHFLNYILNTEDAHKYCMSVKTDAVNQSNINAKKIGAYQFYLPPIEEQEIIVRALNDIDELIINLEKLIEKKKSVKQGVMQELLSGKRRLPGFDGQWEKRKLGEFIECIRGVSYDGFSDVFATESEKTIRLLRSNNIQDGSFVNDEIQFVRKAKVRPKQYIQKEDIMICMANGSRALVGKNCLFMSDMNTEYSFGAFMSIARKLNDDVNMNYIHLLMNSDDYWLQISSLFSGSSINNLRPDDILSMKFLQPVNVAEMKAISDLLMDMEKDIYLLQNKLKKYQQFKQGMMQKLLTGEIRLV